MTKKAITQAEIHELIANRWSPRSFDPDKAVSDTNLLALLEAARWAPSCFNDQPWRYLVFNRANNIQAWQEALSCLGEKNQKWARNAPVLLAAVTGESFGHNNKPNRWGQYDTGAASLNLCLQAEALGMAVHQMGGFEQEAVKTKFNIPEGYVVMAMMAVGYRGTIEQLDKAFVESETAARKRAALSERFFINRWGEGYDVKK